MKSWPPIMVWKASSGGYKPKHLGHLCLCLVFKILDMWNWEILPFSSSGAFIILYRTMTEYAMTIVLRTDSAKIHR